jgi:N-acetylated-alpha-linked acidic dipeptidase
LLAARISETPILPLNLTDYADGLAHYLDTVKDKLGNSSKIGMEEAFAPFGPLALLGPAIAKLRNETVTFDEEAKALADELESEPIPWWRWWDRIKQAAKINHINTTYKLFERNFLYSKGLDGRPWFKHVVFAPGLWTGYSGATFPGLVESIDSGDKQVLWKWAGIILGLIDKSRASLVA